MTDDALKTENPPLGGVALTDLLDASSDRPCELHETIDRMLHKHQDRDGFTDWFYTENLQSQ